MNSKVEVENVSLDSVKLGLALVSVSGAVMAFYYFEDTSLLFRVLGLVGTVVVSAVIASQTERGRNVTGFLKEAQVEVRKVVWPTRKEAVQTTGLVLVVVVVAALILWGFDALLSVAIRTLMGG